MQKDQQEVLQEIQKSFEMKLATEKVAADIQETLTTQCQKAHKLGLSDRQISEGIEGGLSRTRIQQLRTRK